MRRMIAVIEDKIMKAGCIVKGVDIQWLHSDAVYVRLGER